MHTTTRIALPLALLLTGALLAPVGCSAGAQEATESNASAVSTGTLYFSTDHTILFGAGFAPNTFLVLGEMNENLEPLAYRNVGFYVWTNADGAFSYTMRPTSLPCPAELLFRAFTDEVPVGGGSSGSSSGSSSSGSSGSSSGGFQNGDGVITVPSISNSVGYYNTCRILHL